MFLERLANISTVLSTDMAQDVSQKNPGHLLHFSAIQFFQHLDQWTLAEFDKSFWAEPVNRRQAFSQCCSYSFLPRMAQNLVLPLPTCSSSRNGCWGAALGSTELKPDKFSCFSLKIGQGWKRHLSGSRRDHTWSTINVSFQMIKNKNNKRDW